MTGDAEDREALERAYAGLRRFAAVVGPADVEPDDLVQEAFARALRRGLGEVEDLDRYLRRTIVNLSANERRSWTRRQLAFARHGSTTETRDSTFIEVGDLLDLATDVRAVLWLVEVEGWSYAQAGALVGCSEGAARMRAARGRRALRAAGREEA
jgi:RNA polymerase sigma factor (sigma-70 family)